MSHHHHHNHQHHQNHEHHHKIEGSGQKWQQRNPNYSSMDSAPQTFFYTLTNLMKLNQAKNILEIGCGAGKLLSTALDLKDPNATYIATDFSEGMINEAKKRLQIHFTKYQSKITFDEWLHKQHLLFDVQNGEDIKLKENILSDRIIANMVVCHADDPQKMLKNWNSIATDDCILGISLLGDPQKNNLVRGMRQDIVQAGQKLPEGNPPYHWFDKISKIVEASGWQIILEWQQNSLFPFLSTQDMNLKNFIEKRCSQKPRQLFMKRVHKLINEDKVGIQVWCKAIIAKKKSVK